MWERPQKSTNESTHKFWFANMSKHVNPPCTSNHHTHCKNQTTNNHKPSNHLTNQTKLITHRQSKQISTQTHKNQPLDTQICHCQFRHPLPLDHDPNLVPPPPIDVDQCMWERETKSQVRKECDSAGRGENKKKLLVVVNNMSRWL